ncbi:MAG: ABC transporter permease [Lachnospiraceae bacterium]|nr:ABC transporter permease [Lachnospiraceae bacterium]
MLGIMLQKMWHKKWMNLSLLLGCILLVATAVCFPLYQDAAYDRMLHDEFDHELMSSGEWPAELNIISVARKDKEGKVINGLEKLVPQIYSNMGVTEKETIYYYTFAQNGIHSTMNRRDADELNINLAAKSGLKNHVTMLSGEMFSDTGMTDDGEIEVVISQSAMVSMGLLVGETVVYDALRAPDGGEIKMHITGVYNEDGDESYWQEDNGFFDTVLLMDFDLFREKFTGTNGGKYTTTCYITAMFEYKDLSASDVSRVQKWTKYYDEESSYGHNISTPVYAELLNSYENKYSRISATLVILQIPVLIMLAAFLLMISSQMYEMERNEISVIKSRGSSRAQIFRMYLYQAILLNIVGTLLGLPLGMLMSKLLGSTRNFLVFDFSETLDVKFTTTALIYLGGAVFLGLLCLTVPAIKHSRVSIVNLKQQKAMRKKALWEKLFVDLVLLAVAGYGFYNFQHNSDKLSEAVLNGKSLDPLLYLSSSLMIIGGGLLFLRLQPYLLKLIYNIGKKHWKPASFVSFMENVKNGRKQQLIMLFLIMTVSLGMYHATVARTIVENAVQNTNYLDGADLVLKEVWTEIQTREGKPTGEYVEPNTDKYMTAQYIERYTRVYNDSKAYISTGGNSRIDVNLLGIHTKEFGEITWVDMYLNNEHYYNYLNELAAAENGVLVSANFRDKLGYKVGDSISYSNAAGKTATGVIVDFVSYFPGYSPEVRELLSDGTLSVTDSYMVVANFEYMKKKLGNTPYEIWITTKEGTTEADIYNWIQSEGVRLTKYVNRDVDLENAESDPLLQGTNGILTLGFVVTIILCGVGYLIYWIMSIRERELVFGVLRASGFHKGELFQMLINEQIFCGLLSILAGFGIGKITSVMFVPILQKAYSSTSQVLPMELITNPADMQRLIGVVAGVMFVCIAVLTGMILRMNVAKALKLGED